MAPNMLIIHGGGPTAVLNSSLYGAVMEAKAHGGLGHIYGAVNGTGGLLRKELVCLEDMAPERLSLLLGTPGSAIGTSRDRIDAPEYELMFEILRELGIEYVLFNGGNGTMDTCGKLHRLCRDRNSAIQVMGIPKTMDNDIAMTDHSPGFGSAALFMAQSAKELCMDVAGLPIHVVVLEAQGRNAGWVTAAASLAGEEGLGPDLVYVPERPFDQEAFLEDVERLLQVKKGIVVVAGEGLKDARGESVVPPIFRTERAVYFGDVSTHLANLVVKHLGYKARGEKPGLLGRASVALQSPVDRQEAVWMGRVACQALWQGKSGMMAAMERQPGEVYGVSALLVDIEQVMMHERILPPEYINDRGNGVTQAFRDWCRPLLGRELTPMLRLNDGAKEGRVC